MEKNTHAYVHGNARMHAYTHDACILVHAWKTIRMHTCTEKHICMHAWRMHAYIHGKEYACIHAWCMCTCRKICMHICMEKHMCMCACMHGEAHMHASMHGTCVHAWKRIRTHTCMEKHICMHTCMDKHICMHARMHGKAHMHAYMHGQTHLHEGRTYGKHKILIRFAYSREGRSKLGKSKF